MIPVQSSIPIIGDYVYGNQATENFLIDYDFGGIGLNDSSQGLLVQTWKAELLNFRDVYVSAPNTPKTYVFSSGYQITQLSLTFDQLMRPYIAFLENGLSKLYWFDSVIPGPAILTLPTGSRSPRVKMDDKRPEFTSTSDIILAYIRSGKIYVRVQRERYLIEHEFASGIPDNVELLKFGFTDNYRLRFDLATKMTEDQIINGELAKGSPISGYTPVTEDDSTSPSSSDLWELDSGD